MSSCETWRVMGQECPSWWHPGTVSALKLPRPKLPRPPARLARPPHPSHTHFTLLPPRARPADESHANFSQYSARFAGVAAHAGARSGSGSALYYSFNMGLVHWVMFSTEVYWAQPAVVEAQINWLKKDLAAANANRAQTPWIIAAGHKSWYMDTTYCSGASCYANATWFDSLLHEAGVDLYFVGHMHEYRRLVPAHGTANATDLACASGAERNAVFTNCKYLATIVTGAPGNPEAQPPDCGGPAPHDPQQPTLTCSRNYGFGFLQVHNATHASWQWDTALPIAGSPDPVSPDSLLVVAEQHGPRSWV